MDAAEPHLDKVLKYNTPAANKIRDKRTKGLNIAWDKISANKKDAKVKATEEVTNEQSQTDIAKLHRIFKGNPGKMAKGLLPRPWGPTWDKYHQQSADTHTKKAKQFADAANQKGIGRLTKTRNIEAAERHASLAQANRKEIPMAPDRVKLFRDAVAKRKANQMKKD